MVKKKLKRGKTSTVAIDVCWEIKDSFGGLLSLERVCGLQVALPENLWLGTGRRWRLVWVLLLLLHLLLLLLLLLH
jgi:hypothetical protein